MGTPARTEDKELRRAMLEAKRRREEKQARVDAIVRRAATGEESMAEIIRVTGLPKSVVAKSMDRQGLGRPKDPLFKQ